MVFAHADDETLLAGALIARLASDGHNVTVLCLAPGDDDRTKRLHKACEVLGVTTVETLRYSRGVMWRDELDQVSNAREDLKLTPTLSVVPVGHIVNRVSGRISEINRMLSSPTLSMATAVTQITLRCMRRRSARLKGRLATQ